MIDVKKIINKELKKTNKRDLWIGSKYENWQDLDTPQAKGSVGVDIYKEWLISQGYKAKKVSDQGDILWSQDGGKTWIKDEVKTATVGVKKLIRGNHKGLITESIWVNQIRPAQKEWKGIVIVGIYPNHVKIFRKSREDWDNQCDKISSIVKAAKHTGQSGSEQLEAVSLIKNSNRNNFDEWECIYSDQQGEQV